ncbi:DUF2711 family protein (plasmid) [Priestia megaterium]|uniref:DUF2711 family protein n=1 Tax=Priestia megaterium (strain ATCC 14581 / DSM 32 / CCUG 1817 / JCM 2506 / NBRC 15308 / NCIMB 9376 / NCTC 10342 / NRRL B-14308 / VKM B-512 / Ford 19) TaxID=1348623 RepID=A0A0B6AR11_PRIM2|nr:DUF2711 family protein [Priestia megaterium]AJI25856.1 hypothetical protein BG04_5675 [Priestia megaterium NBRC 15308 = ATCC 14581]KFN07549.1 hypothetical protein DJ91_5313 [Priestia megaterium]KGJ82771.1 hypothetical protein BMT_16060 [Priestia megaterium NBRC 15308 = ATCC 14581]MDR4229736.1 DUF2711 family protein [Priestia megaterium]MED4399181.1 DUF2711 family protein [Priestia megaterium]
MLDYIWIDGDLPILSQLSNDFNSAAVLFHPFIQMPSGWEKSKRENPYQHIYPSDEEMLKLGEPVSWKEVMGKCNLKSYKELSIALQHLTGVPSDEYKKLASYVKSNPDFYYPEEVNTSLFILNSLVKILCSKGANTLYFSEPIHDTNGSFKVNDMSSIEIANLSPNESIITDEKMDFAFMGIYDSFITLLLAKDTNIEDTIKSLNLEAFICDKETYLYSII